MLDFEHFEIQADFLTAILQIGVLVLEGRVSILYWVKVSLLKMVELGSIPEKCFAANSPVLTSRT